MVIITEVRGVFATNAYFYIDNATNHGFLIDPGAEPERLLRVVNERRLIIEKILITHGHFDHFGAAEALRDKLKVPVCMQENGFSYMSDPRLNLSLECGMPMTLGNVTFLDDYTTIFSKANENFSLKLIPVPGHTPDGAVYYSEADGVAFVGDSIFKNSFGLTHFYGGNAETLYRSVKDKILTLPDNTALLSGHSEPTTVGEERQRPWFL